MTTVQTNDPHLTKTPLDETITQADIEASREAKRSAKVESETIENTKGQETFEEGVVDTKHVNDGDNPARQPDPRDQKGEAFDGGVNSETVPSDEPITEEINERNRYATIDKAQTRTL